MRTRSKYKIVCVVGKLNLCLIQRDYITGRRLQVQDEEVLILRDDHSLGSVTKHKVLESHPTMLVRSKEARETKRGSNTPQRRS